MTSQPVELRELPPPTGQPVVPTPAAESADGDAAPAQPAPREPAPQPARSEPTRGVRRGLFGLLLAGTAVLYLWGLSKNGWANAYYSAAAQAAGASWKAWFFGSFDAANAITVDKPPASLWVMGLSVRLFGLSYWSVLVPQALMGVGAVALLYSSVRRWFGTWAGLIAGAVMALTPVATLMFRFNNPDALLVLLLVASAYAMTRATEKGSLRWITLAGALVGLGFLTKMMQAFLVLPGFIAMYAVAAPIAWRRKVGHLFAAFAAMLASAGWWVTVVELWPASSRPYIGGSQTNSMLELIFGYNGFGRLTGNETGSVGGGNAAGSRWGETGWARLFTSSYGGQIAWLLPAALAMIGVLLWLSRRQAVTSRLRAATLAWGGWLLVTGAVISFSQGIIHEYYTVALAPAIGALVGIGATELWARRTQLPARLTMAALMAITAIWGYLLLARSATFLPWLRFVVLFGGLAITGLLLITGRMTRRTGAAIAAAVMLVSLAGPAAYSLDTASSVASGSLPSAGPAVAGSRGFGSPGGQGRLGGQGGPGQGGMPGFPPGGFPQGAQGTQGTAPSPTQQGAQNTFPGNTLQGTDGGAGGLLNASTPSAELTAALLADADKYTWVAATSGSQSAAGYQLATQKPVMALGGFNGSDPSPTLAQFEALVAAGKIHYYISGGMGGGDGRGGFGGTTESSGNDIASWVQANYTAVTIGGTTVYDLTSPLTTATSGTASSVTS